MKNKHAAKIAKFVVRWGIAVVGIAYVLNNMTWHDHIRAILPGQSTPQSLTLASPNAGEDDPQYVVVDPKDPSEHITVPRDAVVSKSGQAVLQIGIQRMVREANGWYLMAALAIFPITIIITSIRWHELLKALDVRLTLGRTFVLNMVGAFYNTFIPAGSTGGDLLKAYYVAKQTHHRTRAVMSVLVDRAVGLLALIILGGTMAALRWDIPMCRHVAIVSAVIIGAVAVGMIVFYVPVLHRGSGLEFFLSKLPMQAQVKKAVEALQMYGRRPVLATVALIASFPVHMIVIIAAMLCGHAFKLPIPDFYYWMAVPVIVLSGAIPISPQGAGVMEAVAITLLKPQSVSVTQAVALTMSIRLTQILWNLAGLVFVLRGGFHAPSESEQKEVDNENQDEEEKPDGGISDDGDPSERRINGQAKNYPGIVGT